MQGDARREFQNDLLNLQNRAYQVNATAQRNFDRAVERINAGEVYITTLLQRKQVLDSVVSLCNVQMGVRCLSEG